MGTLHKLVDSRESQQTQRFRWREGASGFYVVDTQTNQAHWMGTGESLFCNEDNEDCLKPGTQRFYDALNSYFEHEQADIAEKYYGWVLGEQPVNSKGVG